MAAGRRSQRGSVMLFAVVLGLLAMAIWVVAWRATHDAIRVERFVKTRDRGDDTTLEAVAAALALLETGVPPDDPFEALYENADGDVLKVTFDSDGDVLLWDVEAVAADDSDVATLPDLPATFEGP